MALVNIDNYIDTLPKHRRDFLEVFGNQWSPVKQMPGTCEACVWGESNHLHARDCVTGRSAVLQYVETIRTDAQHVVMNPFDAFSLVSDELLNAVSEGGRQLYLAALDEARS